MLKSGTHLGPYKILSQSGAGGMGQVYKARDTRLERTVAIKVLPPHLSADHERRQRFEREARTIASLNHPHICTLYDIGHAEIEESQFADRKSQQSQSAGRKAQIDGRGESAIFDLPSAIHYLVMEYLEGETVADRLKKGALPLDQVLTYGIEISDALDKAHGKGITHRDLKPGNIMLTRAGSKLLDFGLAKLREPRSGDSRGVAGRVPVDSSAVTLGDRDDPRAGPLADARGSDVPTLRDSLTIDGAVLGTLQYMAPEQVEGRTDDIDGRTDIFAFGALVYEMATGKKAFEGKSQASLIAAILEREVPPMSSLQPMTPASLDRVIKKCLVKEQENRWQSAKDLHDELEWIREGGGQESVKAEAKPTPKLWRRALPWAVTAVVTLAAVLAVAFYPGRSATPASQRVIFPFLPPQNASFAGSTSTNPPAVSPDGTQLAFRAFSEGAVRIWVRPLDSLEARAVPGTEGVDDALFFWSPDSRSLAFSAQGRMKKIDREGGQPAVLADLKGTAAPRGGDWNREGTIIFSLGIRGLYRVSAAGGEAVQIRTTDIPRGELALNFPSFLPDGRHFLYSITAIATRSDVQGIYVGSLDSKESKRLLGVTSRAEYAPPGYLLYVTDGTLMAHPFDAERLELSGEPFPLAANVVFNASTNSAAFSASENGVLVYRTGSSTVNSQLAWFDRSGRQLGTAGPPGAYLNPKLSPDGKRVAVEQLASGNRDIWIVDVASGIASRFTFDPAPDFDPFWSPDGKSVAVTRKASIYRKPSSGSGSEEVLLRNAVGTSIWDWSPDGRFFAYRPMEGVDVSILPLAGERKALGFLNGEFNEIEAQVSPNGKWCAYLSNETGRYEVYVQSFPKPGGKWQVTNNGGIHPRWRHDGKELFYIALDGKLMAVPVSGEEGLEISTSQSLFETRIVEGAATEPYLIQQYDVSPDGQRFLMNVPAGDAAASPTITVVVNWPAGLKKQ